MGEDDLPQFSRFRSAAAQPGCTPAGFGWDAVETEAKYQFMCNIFPNSIGKPIFSQTLPMFTGAR